MLANTRDKFKTAGNRVETLKGLETLRSLLELICADNKIKTFDETRFVAATTSISRLDLRGNPVTGVVDYRTGLLFRMRHLTCLDGDDVNPLEKVAAVSACACACVSE